MHKGPGAMTEGDSRKTTKGLTFSDNISIVWKPVESPPAESLLALVNESNEAFLRAVSAIGTFAGDPSEDDVALSQEIARLDLKITMLLDLVSQLIYKQLDIPERTLVTISSSDIEWSGDSVPDPGSIVFVQAYIQHGTPKPLSFYGEVVSSREDFAEGRAKVRYLGLSGLAQSWLDKIIFRHHRREIAYMRSQDQLD